MQLRLPVLVAAALVSVVVITAPASATTVTIPPTATVDCGSFVAPGYAKLIVSGGFSGLTQGTGYSITIHQGSGAASDAEASSSWSIATGSTVTYSSAPLNLKSGRTGFIAGPATWTFGDTAASISGQLTIGSTCGGTVQAASDPSGILVTVTIPNPSSGVVIPPPPSQSPSAAPSTATTPLVDAGPIGPRGPHVNTGGRAEPAATEFAGWLAVAVGLAGVAVSAIWSARRRHV